MKIVCDSCGAKYSIADEKVAGKVFKIRCKKCQNIIVVRGNKPEEQAAAGEPALDGAGAEEGGGFQETPVWHVVIDREQVGPMTPSEVRDSFARGDISEETFIWREGFSDWLRLDAVDDFSDMAQATKVAPASMAMGGAAPASFEAPANAWGQEPESQGAPGFQDQAAAGLSPESTDPWSGQEGGAPGADAPAAAAPAAGPDEADSAHLEYKDPNQARRRDLFATYAGEENVADLMGAGFGAAAAADAAAGVAPAGIPDNAQVSFQSAGGAAPAAAQDPGFPSDPSEPVDDSKMTGQRNENSVLFSLNNLQALAMGKPASPEPGLSAVPDTGGDGSGLIDIRAMAGNAGLADVDNGGADDLSDIGAFTAPVSAAPVLLPSMEDDRPKWLMPLIVGMAATLLIMVGLVLWLVMRTPEGPIVAVAPAAATGTAAKAGSPTTAAATGTAKVAGEKKADPAAEKKADPAGEKKADPAAEKKAEPTKVASRSGRKKGSNGARKGKSKPASAKSSDPLLAAAAPKKKARRRSGKRDELDDLIDNAIATKPKKKKKARSRSTSSRSTSTRSKPAAAAPAANSNLPETLSRGDIQKGMRGIKGKVQGCYDKFKVPGLASAKVTIGRAGRVTNSTVKGVFAGTPTGSCVKKATGSARFPKFKGTPITITYPFILR